MSNPTYLILLLFFRIFLTLYCPPTPFGVLCDHFMSLYARLSMIVTFYLPFMSFLLSELNALNFSIDALMFSPDVLIWHMDVPN